MGDDTVNADDLIRKVEEATGVKGRLLGWKARRRVIFLCCREIECQPNFYATYGRKLGMRSMERTVLAQYRAAYKIDPITMWLIGMLISTVVKFVVAWWMQHHQDQDAALVVSNVVLRLAPET